MRRGIARNPDIHDLATCGYCARTWDDSIITSMTPAPAARCPFEHFHDDTNYPIPADFPVKEILR